MNVAFPNGLTNFYSHYTESVDVWTVGILVRAAYVRCHGTKCPLLAMLFLFFLLSFSLSARVTFLPEGLIVGF